jgi:hypothetical protein
MPCSFIKTHHGSILLKTSLRLGILILLSLFVLAACGYHNPTVYSGPEKTIYVTHWKNRTNVLQLDAKIYQSLTHWFQKSNALKVSNQKAGADLILAGEIIAIQQPGLAYGAGNRTSAVKMTLTVRYILKDIKTNEVLLEVPSEVWTENASTTRVSAATADNETQALAGIIDDLSEKIYIKSITKLAEMK